MNRTLPFSPKSTSTLQLGDFWSIKLTDSRYACGRVIGWWPKDYKGHKKGFLGGLLNWCSELEPTFESIAGAEVIIQGGTNTNSLSSTKSLVLGNRPLELDGITPQTFIEYPDNKTPYIYHGLEPIRPATKMEIEMYEVVNIFGNLYLQALANQEFVGKVPNKPLKQDK